MLDETYFEEENLLAEDFKNEEYDLISNEIIL